MANTEPVDKKSIPGKGMAGMPAAKKTPVMQSGAGKSAAPGQTQPQAHIQQAAPTTSIYKPPPGQQPCAAPAPPAPPVPTPPPAPSPAPVPATDSTITELLQKIVADHETFSRIFQTLTDISQKLTTATKADEDYFDTPLTVIAVATPVQPNSPDTFSNATTVPPSPGYQTETVYARLGRIAPKMFVINDGTDSLFVISTANGNHWSSEVTILTGEARTFYNVFEIRFRSPSAGTLTPVLGGVYRAVERDYWLAYTKPVAGGAPNRAAFIAQSIIVPDLLDHALSGLDAAILAANPGNVLPIAVPSEFALVIRANVNNVGVVYISASNATTAVARDTLNPGDTAKLSITNSSLIHVAVANINDIFDILVEQ